jgi:hypothetical protein
MTGIELLLMIKEEMIEDGTEINVFKEEKDRFCKLITAIMFVDNELRWAPGTFKSSMLWNDDFYFEIVESNEDKSIEEISFLGNGFINFNEGYWKGRKMDIAFANKINEVIKEVNKIKKEYGRRTIKNND